MWHTPQTQVEWHKKQRGENTASQQQLTLALEPGGAQFMAECLEVDVFMVPSLIY